MYKDLVKFLKNKNIAILGYGKEGISTCKFIRKYLPDQKITVLDRNKDLQIEDNMVDLVTGDNHLDNLERFDLIIKAPGVRLKDIDISLFKDKLTSQLGLTLDFYSKNLIGITGSKGKSTTTSLIYQILKDQDVDCYLLGNIGIPIFDYINRLKEDTKLVIEMAGPQLEFVKSSPHIGIILNLFEEHLDFFGTKEKYFAPKMKMFDFQDKDDFGIYSSFNNTLNEYVVKGNYQEKTNLINVGKDIILEKYLVKYNNKILYNSLDKRNLLGEHNLTNIMFALVVSELLKLDNEKTIKTINTFKTLEHRMEYVGQINGVKYYNDSIATIPDATINCVKALKDVDTIIFGGMDRGIDYSNLIKFFNESTIKNFICMPDTGNKIGKELTKGNVYYCKTLEEAVKKAKNVTKKICVMSPAASSYNMFKNFEEKGKRYKELVLGKK